MSGAEPRSSAKAFRLRLLASMMLVVLAITAVALYLAKRSADAEVQLDLQSEFQGEVGYLLGLHEARLAGIAENFRSLARSVRIRTALEEDDVEDLYLNGQVELRSVLAQSGSANEPALPQTRHATFFRFLNARGEPLAPPQETGAEKGEAWEAQLALGDGVPEEQQIGYISLGGLEQDAVREIITTPLYSTDTAEVIGAIVLGFKPVELDVEHAPPGLKSGIWFDGQLHLPALSPSAAASVGAEVARTIRANDTHAVNRTVSVDGAPHLLFHKVLNPGSHYPHAYQVCLYPLGDAQARQQKLRLQILGSSFCLLIGGLGASHFISARFSKPVQQLASDSAHNLAERERAEAALELTEQKYRSIYENAVEGIFLLGADGRFLNANPAVARIFGYESDEEFVNAIDDPGQQLYAKPEQFREFLDRAAVDGTASHFEAEVRRKDGRRIWVSQNARAVPGTNGSPLHYEGTLEDITERKHASDALVVVNAELEKALADLKSTQKQIIQQERLRALGQMASGVAHDFNNALVPIQGFAELLQINPATLDDKPTALKYLEIIQTAAKDASSVVARLREFYRSRDHREGFVSIKLDTLLEQAVTLTRPKWKDQAQANGATIEVKLMLEPMPPISGEDSALREVLTNLIFNAVDAMPSGGTITLRTHRLGESAVIEISDTGTGMTEEVRNHCLEPFFSTKGERGTGLGLSMVFGIVQRHSGTINIRSTVGHGTTFVLTLPLHQSAMDTNNAASSISAPGRSLRVLVVDDEPQVRELLSAALRVDGHRVELSTHGVEGLKRFLDSEFDLVLTDKAMPGMSGDQLATAIKQIAPKTPVILLTGFGQFLDPAEYPDVDVLAPKPISIPALREAIANALQAV